MKGKQSFCRGIAKTLQRELATLEAIRNHNPKYLLTMDHTPPTSHNGIKQLNVLDQCYYGCFAQGCTS